MGVYFAVVKMLSQGRTRDEKSRLPFLDTERTSNSLFSVPSRETIPTRLSRAVTFGLEIEATSYSTET